MAAAAIHPVIIHTADVVLHARLIIPGSRTFISRCHSRRSLARSLARARVLYIHVYLYRAGPRRDLIPASVTQVLFRSWHAATVFIYLFVISAIKHFLK